MTHTKSQEQLIYEALLNGDILTAGNESYHRFKGCMNLRSRISGIEKKRNITIDRRRVTKDGVSYNEYFINKFKLF